MACTKSHSSKGFDQSGILKNIYNSIKEIYIDFIFQCQNFLELEIAVEVYRIQKSFISFRPYIPTASKCMLNRLLHNRRNRHMLIN